MKIQRNGSAQWSGGIKDGKGSISTESGALKSYPYGFASRFEGKPGSNPEELLGAAHAGCFTMALVAQLSGAGFTPTEIQTEAKVSFDKVGDGFAITRVDLQTSADVAGLDDVTFQGLAADAKKNCPVSKALAAIDIGMKATLKQTERAPAATVEKD